MCGSIGYRISTLRKTSYNNWVSLTLSRHGWRKKTGVSNQLLLSWLEFFYASPWMFYFFVLWWNPLFELVIVMMTNQIGTRDRIVKRKKYVEAKPKEKTFGWVEIGMLSHGELGPAIMTANQWCSKRVWVRISIEKLSGKSAARDFLSISLA